MSHERTDKCKKVCVRCLLAAAFVNNTPVGFLIEHTIWDRMPYLRLLPPLLGIH